MHSQRCHKQCGRLGRCVLLFCSAKRSRMCCYNQSTFFNAKWLILLTLTTYLVIIIGNVHRSYSKVVHKSGVITSCTCQEAHTANTIHNIDYNHGAIIISRTLEGVLWNNKIILWYNPIIWTGSVEIMYPVIIDRFGCSRCFYLKAHDS